MRLKRFTGALAVCAALASAGFGPAASAAETAAAACPPSAQPLSPADVATGMRDATDGGFLWKITRDGHASYLYGTLHVAQRAWMFPGPRVGAALRASDVLALELDPTDVDVMTRLQRAIARQPGAPELAAPLAARLRAQMAAACVDPSTLAGLRPEMRAVTLEVMAGRRLGLQPDYGIDLVLAGAAAAMRKPIRSLETPESQAALLVSDDPAETARTVGATLAELESGDGPVILARLAGDWRRGDLDDLGRYAQWCDCMTTPEQRADFVKLIDERNPPMADKIARWHAEGRTLFVAVGSLHLVGDVGLPQLLKARGFEVERIALDPAR
jgi:uncharacterized protein YbaP (TraB family)